MWDKPHLSFASSRAFLNSGVLSSFGSSDDGGKETNFSLALLSSFWKTEFGISSIILKTLLDLGLKFRLIKNEYV